MNESCRFEADVLDAAKSDLWSEALRAHVSDCVECAAAASVSPWMQRFAAAGHREHILPHPAVLWLKAQLLRGNAEASRITRPMTVVQLLAYAVIAAGWAALLTWKWEAVEAWLENMTPLRLVANVSDASALSFSFFATVLMLGSATVMVALHTILAEE